MRAWIRKRALFFVIAMPAPTVDDGGAWWMRPTLLAAGDWRGRGLEWTHVRFLSARPRNSGRLQSTGSRLALRKALEGMARELGAVVLEPAEVVRYGIGPGRDATPWLLRVPPADIAGDKSDGGEE